MTYFHILILQSTYPVQNGTSQTARIFDPVEFLSPMIFLAKRILQLLWLSKSDWNEIPSHENVET